MSQARNGRAEWFELSEEGWRRSNRARPLGQLVREALQNAFDQNASRVRVRLAEDEVRIEDDAPAGLARDEFAFTVFLGEKDTPPTWRGRKGRGLKEMIAASDHAEVETVGRTLVFDHTGRHVKPNTRLVGTCLRLFRRTSVSEREEAVGLLRLTIPPPGVELIINGRTVRTPRVKESLEDCVLETVELHRGVERYVERATRVDLYHPRPGETPHLFELGLPVEPHHLPWHVDVQQRIPLAAERDAARDAYKRTLAAILLESLAPELNRQELSGAWVTEVLSHFTLSEDALEAYVAKVLPPRAVLSVDARTDDRARQLGAKVVDLRGMPFTALEQLETIVESADAYVERMEGPPRDVLVTPGPRAERFVGMVRCLSRELIGREVRVEFFERKVRDPSAHVDAEYDRERRVLRVNMRGQVRLDDPLAPQTLGIVLHELAHEAGDEHDFAFIDKLESFAGRALRCLVDRPDLLAPYASPKKRVG
ncbi:ATP-binding protein [Archangium violaceum]|uniref:ATP-binding protein n=1 Tax=Archangium violaceum TaxID=83451 RepID=UPI00193B2C30|nr:ATP-binding protein [Archangium violaceum]QRK12969.1 ATP-binding protein [Archangium violaceum]